MVIQGRSLQRHYKAEFLVPKSVGQPSEVQLEALLASVLRSGPVLGQQSTACPSAGEVGALVAANCWLAGGQETRRRSLKLIRRVACAVRGKSL